MPLYEYNCQACGKSFEKLVFRLNQRDLISCPDCGAKADRKKYQSQYSFTFSPYLRELKEGNMIDY